MNYSKQFSTNNYPKEDPYFNSKISHTLVSNIRPKLVISNELLCQICNLHKEIPDLEWSGVLLYDTNGKTIAELNELIINAKRMVLMNMGSAAFTSYSISSANTDDLFDQFDFENDNLKTAQIHTHHSMKTFFSGTDMEDLITNGKLFGGQMYLSLVVNYSQKFTAKIAFATSDSESKSTIKQNTVIDGEVVSIEHSIPFNPIEVLVFDCDVEFEKSPSILRLLEKKFNLQQEENAKKAKIPALTTVDLFPDKKNGKKKGKTDSIFIDWSDDFGIEDINSLNEEVCDDEEDVFESPHLTQREFDAEVVATFNSLFSSSLKIVKNRINSRSAILTFKEPKQSDKSFAGYIAKLRQSVNGEISDLAEILQRDYVVPSKKEAISLAIDIMTTMAEELFDAKTNRNKSTYETIKIAIDSYGTK